LTSCGNFLGELRRISLLGTWVNKGKEKSRSAMPRPSRFTYAPAPPRGYAWNLLWGRAEECPRKF
jgi:hypothetical protein